MTAGVLASVGSLYFINPEAEDNTAKVTVNNANGDSKPYFVPQGSSRVSSAFLSRVPQMLNEFTPVPLSERVKTNVDVLGSKQDFVDTITSTKGEAVTSEIIQSDETIEDSTSALDTHVDAANNVATVGDQSLNYVAEPTVSNSSTVAFESVEESTVNTTVSYESTVSETTSTVEEESVSEQPALVQSVAEQPVVAAATPAPVETKTVEAALAPAVPLSSKSASIFQAALAQIGTVQDCTMLVTNALRSVGINFHGWPAGYLSLGTVVSEAEAVPGDLVYYKDGGLGLAHIGVYAGGGKAIHGGWNGDQTVMNTAHLGSGPVFIRVK